MHNTDIHSAHTTSPSPLGRVGERSFLFFLLFTLLHYSAPAQIITTIAGRSTVSGLQDSCSNIGEGVLATAASINYIQGICLDDSGNLYMGYELGYLRKIYAHTGIITTVAGPVGTITSADSVPATNAYVRPYGMFIDTGGNIIFADFGSHRVRKINQVTGIITTIAGQASLWGYGGDNGPATAALLDAPMDVKQDAMHNIYIADDNTYHIRKINAATGIITTVAGNGLGSFGGDNGPATDARLEAPQGLCIDPAGNIYIADLNNYRIRKVTAATGIITTIAGNGIDTINGIGGPATAASIGQAHKLAMDDTGNLYIATGTIVGAGGVDGDYRILKLHTATGIITTFAGSRNVVPGMAGYPGDGHRADSAYLEPNSMCFDTCGNMYVADQRCRVRKIATAHPCDTAVGIARTPAKAGIQVFPNPVTGMLTVGGITGNTTYTLFAASGIKMQQGILSPHSNKLDVAAFPAGIYILQLSNTDGGRSMIKVLKE